MVPVYIKNNKKLKYFVFGMNKKNDDDKELHFHNVEIVKNYSFQNSCDVKIIFFDEKLKTIEKEAFKDCKNLEVFCCGKFSGDEQTEIENLKINDLKKNQESNTDNRQTGSDKISVPKDTKEIYDNFTVQAFAFSDCESLQTVVFPKCSELIIEKSAFENCLSLRTIFAFCDGISFTENPFEDCPNYLTFVCQKDSVVERFARENGYRIVNVK